MRHQRCQIQTPDTCIKYQCACCLQGETFPERGIEEDITTVKLPDRQHWIPFGNLKPKKEVTYARKI